MAAAEGTPEKDKSSRLRAHVTGPCCRSAPGQRRLSTCRPPGGLRLSSMLGQFADRARGALLDVPHPERLLCGPLPASLPSEPSGHVLAQRSLFPHPGAKVGKPWILLRRGLGGVLSPRVPTPCCQAVLVAFMGSALSVSAAARPLSFWNSRAPARLLLCMPPRIPATVGGRTEVEAHDARSCPGGGRSDGRVGPGVGPAGSAPASPPSCPRTARQRVRALGSSSAAEAQHGKPWGCPERSDRWGREPLLWGLAWSKGRVRANTTHFCFSFSSFLLTLA
ncbi:uncharacterized protein LOC116576009 [Mustela erminea]|uniref:uncharacterized protein LOC116576009 n=1 Tax=Mustela erminea TaxID=36723 RepID=UPI001387026B|nr:uncharacterized protein LOC116576009 [Mustela erminea]